MRHFVTLYDRGYLSRGIALYESLRETCADPFRLYVLAMDDQVFSWWHDHESDEVVPFTISDMISLYPQLADLKKERPYREFCFTCSSFSIQYIFKKYCVESCTYLDSDLCFYSDPAILHDELQGEQAVLITPHNFTPEYDQTRPSGRYCVQFMYFLNNERGNRVLEWWRVKCEESCAMDPLKEQCGDQKYLDDWLSRFPGIVCECENIGCGVAPWNLQKYSIVADDGKIVIIDKITKVKKPLVFFHYHILKHIANDVWRLSNYRTSEDFKELIYKPYIERLIAIEEILPSNNRLKTRYRYIVVKRFMPIPWIPEENEAELIMTCLGDDKISVIDYKGAERLKIGYDIRDNSWIRILSVDDRLFFAEHFHEILWKMNKELLYSCCPTNNDVTYELYRRKNEGKKVMTEITDDVMDLNKTEYPSIVSRRVLRVNHEKDAGYDDYSETDILQYHHE